MVTLWKSSYLKNLSHLTCELMFIFCLETLLSPNRQLQNPQAAFRVTWAIYLLSTPRRKTLTEFSEVRCSESEFTRQSVWTSSLLLQAQAAAIENHLGFTDDWNSWTLNVTWGWPFVDKSLDYSARSLPYVLPFLSETSMKAGFRYRTLPGQNLLLKCIFPTSAMYE